MMPIHTRLYAITTALVAAPAAVALDVETDFESINTIAFESFNVGTAEFSGDAFSGVFGVPHLYRSGSHAWMVNPNGSALIDFGDTNAATVEFWTRLRDNANDSTVYSSFDDAGDMIQTFTISDASAGFQLLSFTGNIDHITVINSASGFEQMNSIDDFGFTPVPEPGAGALLGLGALALLRRRR